MHVPVDAITCHNVMCNNTSHFAALNDYSNALINAILNDYVMSAGLFCKWTQNLNVCMWVRSESAVRPIGTERCGTGRAFGKSCRIDLIVLRISERLLPAMIEFEAATNLSRDPYGIVCYVCLRQSI
jgi:hypothetical protein